MQLSCYGKMSNYPKTKKNNNNNNNHNKVDSAYKTLLSD